MAEGRSGGQTVLYGDISGPALHAERADLIVLTIDNAPTVLHTVSLLRDTYPGVPTIALALDLEATVRQLETEATHVYPEAIEASLCLVATAPADGGIR